MKKVIVRCYVVHEIEMEITEEEEQKLLDSELPLRITNVMFGKIEERGDCFSEISSIRVLENNELIFEV